MLKFRRLHSELNLTCLQQVINMHTYWNLHIDASQQGLWCPGGIRDSAGVIFDDRCLARGKPIQSIDPLWLPVYPFGQSLEKVSKPLLIEVAIPGEIEGIVFANSGMLVSTKSIANMIGEIAGESIQRIAVKIPASDIECEIINVPRWNCIDFDRSEIDWWTNENGPLFPTGRPRYISRLVIDATAARGQEIFRPSGWETSIVISSRLMKILQDADVRGISFDQV